MRGWARVQERGCATVLVWVLSMGPEDWGLHEASWNASQGRFEQKLKKVLLTKPALGKPTHGCQKLLCLGLAHKAWRFLPWIACL